MASGLVTRALKSVAGAFGGGFWASDTADADAPHAALSMAVDSALTPIWGDVTANPEPNTGFDRLKTIAANAATGNGTLASILSTLQAQHAVATSLWTDNTGATFVRRDNIDQDSNILVVTFTDETGSIVTPGTGLRAVGSDSDLETLEALYDVLNTGTGYTAGDVIARAVVIDHKVSPAVVQSSIWVNLTTGATVTPTAGHIRIKEKDSATETTLAAVNSALGATNSSAAANPSATASLNGLIKGMWTALVAALTTSNASLDAIATAAEDNDTPVPVFASGREYEFVAASSSFAALGATGAAGDVLDSIIFVPLTTSPGEVKLRDGTSGTARTIFKGGTDSIVSLQPFEIGLSLKSLASGGWFLDTGANIQCFTAGDFT